MTNVSDIGEFGGTVEHENSAVPSAAKVKLPPLVVMKVPLNTLISDLTSLGVAAEFKLSRIGTKVMLRTKAEYEATVKYLKDSRVEYFTHDIPGEGHAIAFLTALDLKYKVFNYELKVIACPSIPGEKPFKVVIRGLPNFNPKSIEEELKDRYKLAPIAFFRITRRDENVKTYTDCLFLVHFQKGTVTFNALKAIRSINFIIVKWEPYRGDRHDVTKCQRCLNFGHGTRNCYINPRCGKCTQNHVSSECVVDESETCKCANCGGAHQGSDKQCPKREDFKRIRKQASTRSQPGRKQENTPAFRVEDFLPLRVTQHGQANPRV
ncbi:uncharacterized protein LOC135698056 [Ochlerotatus camptorhynchus]|uniref:uncharacterized protein LOC135698056 n=1 Tax=Ochlerotatus camptorhynchus TaxID=644619 RepID=UPI0031D1D448